MKKMMFLSLVLSVMALGSASASDASGYFDKKPKKVYVNINVPPIGGCYGPEYHCCPPPPKGHFCDWNHKPHKKGGPKYHFDNRGGRWDGKGGPHVRPSGKPDGRPARDKGRGNDRPAGGPGGPGRW